MPNPDPTTIRSLARFHAAVDAFDKACRALALAPPPDDGTDLDSLDDVAFAAAIAEPPTPEQAAWEAALAELVRAMRHHATATAERALRDGTVPDTRDALDRARARKAGEMR